MAGVDVGRYASPGPTDDSTPLATSTNIIPGNNGGCGSISTSVAEPSRGYLVGVSRPKCENLPVIDGVSFKECFVKLTKCDNKPHPSQENGSNRSTSQRTSKPLGQPIKEKGKGKEYLNKRHQVEIGQSELFHSQESGNSRSISDQVVGKPHIDETTRIPDSPLNQSTSDPPNALQKKQSYDSQRRSVGQSRKKGISKEVEKARSSTQIPQEPEVVKGRRGKAGRRHEPDILEEDGSTSIGQERVVPKKRVKQKRGRPSVNDVQEVPESDQSGQVASPSFPEPCISTKKGRQACTEPETHVPEEKSYLNHGDDDYEITNSVYSEDLLNPDLSLGSFSVVTERYLHGFQSLDLMRQAQFHLPSTT